MCGWVVLCGAEWELCGWGMWDANNNFIRLCFLLWTWLTWYWSWLWSLDLVAKSSWLTWCPRLLPLPARSSLHDPSPYLLPLVLPPLTTLPLFFKIHANGLYQVQELRKRCPNLNIQVDGGLDLSTIDVRPLASPISPFPSPIPLSHLFLSSFFSLHLVTLFTGSSKGRSQRDCCRVLIVQARCWSCWYHQALQEGNWWQ